MGGSGSPRVTVLSGPLPPRGPVISYWPDLGAICPGLKLGVFAIWFSLPGLANEAFGTYDGVVHTTAAASLSVYGDQYNRSPNKQRHARITRRVPFYCALATTFASLMRSFSPIFHGKKSRVQVHLKYNICGYLYM